MVWRQTTVRQWVAVFGAIVEALVRPVVQAGRDLALRRTVGSAAGSDSAYS